MTRRFSFRAGKRVVSAKVCRILQILKEKGVEIQTFDEKKLKSLGMNALLGVAQGSVRPAKSYDNEMEWSQKIKI